MKQSLFTLAGAIALAALLVTPAAADRLPGESTAHIVQGHDLAGAAAAVADVGGQVTHRLGIIDAVGASLSEAQAERLAELPAVRRIWAGRELEVARGTPQPDTLYPTFIEADLLHDADILGSGVTVAVLDTGTWEGGWISKNVDSQFRILTHYDAINDTTGLGSDDDNGHGTHVTSVILSSGTTKGKNKLFNGVAPDPDLVVVRAFDVNGQGSYADVIRGLDWVVANRDLYGIRVLNLSFAAAARSYYWDDPLNQAVMRAWQAGIVVVAAAGDAGPGPLSVNVPGNVPYVITVGAMSYNQTPAQAGDDSLAAFSSAGPTAEAFVKPDILAPGVGIRGILRDDQVLVQSAEAYLGNNTYELSGTSQAAAVVSGVVALMLEADPALDPDTVKCRLIATARPAESGPGSLAYSVFQQGAGLVNAYDAVNSTATGCANQGLDIAKDLDDTEHYHGLADRDNGVYFLTNRAALTAYDWDGGYQGAGFPFVAGFAWPGGFPLSDGAPFVGPFPFVGPVPDATVYPWQPGLPWINDPYPQIWAGGEPVGVP